MKILVEGTPLIRHRQGYLQHRTGVGNYTYNLLKGMVEKPEYDVEIEGFRSIKDKLAKPSSSQLDFPKLKHVWVPLLPREIYTRLTKVGLAPPLDLLLRKHPDVWIFPNFVRFPLFSKKIKSVVIIYDLSFVKYPQFAKRVGPYLRAAVPRSIKKATHIITISENSKQEIIETYGTRSDKISLIYPAIDHEAYQPQPKTAIAKLKRKLKIEGNYILYTGTLEPRKNIVRLVEAYAHLPKELQQKYQLVLGGAKGWLNDELDQTLSKYKHLPIQLLGYVADDDLPALYTGAGVFLYPSIYEGFGIPPLEAMACGTPVITSNTSSLPEVVGKAAILIDPIKTTDITKALVQVLENPKTQQTMAQAGLKQAKKFNWHDSSDKLLTIVNDFAKQ